MTAIELGGEARDVRERKSGWIDTVTRCKIETDDGEFLRARVMTVGLGMVGEWFRQRQPRVFMDEHGVWKVCGEGWSAGTARI